MTALPSEFGQSVRNARVRAGLSQEELAERSGVSVRAISDMERGLRKRPRPETLRLLADVLGLDADDRATFFVSAQAGVDETGKTRLWEGGEPGEPLTANPLAARPLPRPIDMLIGRTHEIDSLVKLLESDGVRLVTLAGPGGVGKTRLALAVAHDLQQNAGYACAFIDLVPISDPSLAPAEIAAAVGVNDPGQQLLLETLAGRMHGSSWLVVLDNAEHVLGIAPFVADLLRSCPTLRILVTSRQPLHVRGERVFHLEPLPVPSPDQTHRPEDLALNDAVRLFVSRVQEVRPEFALMAANADDVAEICRQLDGLPLAIELAAPRVRLLSPSALRARLQDQLGLLTSGARDAPERQRTLRKTIEWSYDLLRPDEQSLLAALAIFEGGFDLEAAEAVAGESFDLFEGVSALLEQSLLQRRETMDGESRFRMLESIRAFGLECLAQSGLEETIRQRHADYFQALVEAISRRVAERTEPDWYASAVAQCDLELDNLRSAWQWSLQFGVPPGALQLMSDVRTYWVVRPHTAEIATALTSGLLAMPDVPVRDRALAELLVAARSGWLGEFDRAFAAADRCLEAARATGDPALVGRGYCWLGFIWENAGDCDRSLDAFHDAVRWLRLAPADIYLASALGELGDRMLVCGSIAEGIPLLDEALALDRQTGYGDDLVIVLGQRAHGARLEGDWPLALRLFQESFDLAVRLGDNRRALGALMGFAGVAQATGRSELATQLIAATEAARQARGISRSIAHQLHNTLIVADVRSSLGDARYATLLEESRDIQVEQALLLAQTELRNL